MRGLQYTCEKCGQIYYTRYTAASSGAMFDLHMAFFKDDDKDNEDQNQEVDGTVPLFESNDDQNDERHSAA